ncbi:putative peptidoglycan lipid II flippase [Neobacillus bataviensis]|uniref:Probable lipid II flippase MurJ n=1 Tax=Neobacillus bataviensis TaxID=220685 RepID=A0A561CMY3_9BACI|nr:murein biosynthesis integral membrane protein MurJ [Neobacillus bataviensis]TWD92380.1 putative peptidoglycan lipid II flippase [Neobacillus bataviensis]
MGKILKNATLLVVLLTLVSKISGFIREQVIAFQYGATNIADTYSTVLSLPQYVSNIIGGVLLSCFIPLYISIKERDGIKQAEDFTSKIFQFTLLFLILLNVVFWVFADPIGAMYFGEDVTSEQIFLIKIILPSQIILSLAMFFTAKLNAIKIYNSPILSTILMNIIFIWIVIFFKKSSETLILANVISALGQISYLIYKTPKFKLNFNSLNYYVKNRNFKEFLLLGVPVLIGSFSVQAFTIFDKILARDLPDGNIAALSYAQKLTQLPVGIIAMGISTVLLSSLSIIASKGDMQKLNKEIFKGLNLTFILLLPIILIMYYLAVPITKIIFERGEFNHDATIMTAQAVRAYSIGIIGTSLTMVLSRVFFAKKNTIIPVISNLISALVNFIFALFLVKNYQHIGLATANSISVIFNFIFLFVAYLIKFRNTLRFNLKVFNRYMISFVVLVGASLIIFMLLNDIFDPNKNFMSFMLYSISYLVVYSLIVVVLKGRDYSVRFKKILKWGA